MKNPIHKFSIGQTVRLENSIHKKLGTVIIQDQSYSQPTYQVEFDDGILTLLERDLSSI